MNKQIRDQVLKLISEKEKLESELKDLHKILAKNGVGMDDSLVDSEGYPLAHVDIYQVRHARHLIIYKENDLKALMEKIEGGIADYYQGDKVEVEVEAEVQVPQPFAIITVVHPESPADTAGIKTGDLLLEFGSVNANNFQKVEDIGKVVAHSKGQKIICRISREGTIRKVSVTPKDWNGKGLLGCIVKPLD